MDLIEIKLLWQHGFFSSIKKLFKNKRACHQFINIHNFDQLSLANDEITRIQKILKLSKQRIMRCFEIIVLAKLDPHDAQVHQRFGQEIKKKLQQQLTKDILAPYFCIENFQPQTGLLMTQQQNSYYTGGQNLDQGSKRQKCCHGDGELICLQKQSHFDAQKLSAGYAPLA